MYNELYNELYISVLVFFFLDKIEMLLYQILYTTPCQNQESLRRDLLCQLKRPFIVD